MNNNPRTRTFFHHLLHTERQSFLTQSRWEAISPQEIVTITDILVRFHVLDQMLDAVSFPRHLHLSPMPKLPFPYRFPEKLDRVCINYCAWLSSHSSF
jgi:hypothetical protein